MLRTVILIVMLTSCAPQRKIDWEQVRWIDDYKSVNEHSVVRSNDR